MNNLLYYIFCTSRRCSSTGESVRFIPVRLGVQFPPPPYVKNLLRKLGGFLRFHRFKSTRFKTCQILADLIQTIKKPGIQLSTRFDL